MQEVAFVCIEIITFGYQRETKLGFPTVSESVPCSFSRIEERMNMSGWS
jgi:hypothetical protein